MTKVVIDADIPFIKGVLEPWCKVVYKTGSEIDNQTVRESDALIIRTRTRCDKKLLNNTAVRAIFTATIGSDHIDLDYCKSNGIEVFNAAGCNSGGVVQYVITSLFALTDKTGQQLKDKTVGIVGAGNVGERLAQFLEKIGVAVLRCDPPKSLVNNTVKYYSLDYILTNSDVITLHVPLDSSTYSMCSDSFLSKMKSGSILVNTARGEVVDEDAVLRFREKLGAIVTDVWAGEPLINKDLLKVSDIATPHIAGYSYEGKVNATVFSVINFANFFGVKDLKNFSIETKEAPLVINHRRGKRDIYSRVTEVLLERFPLYQEDEKLRTNTANFEIIRSSYIFRREFPEDFANYLATVLF